MNLQWFNYALVGKWLWRFLTDKGTLWARVIRARDGELEWDEGGFSLGGNQRAQSGWWAKVVGLSRGEGGAGLRQNFSLSLGEGRDIRFWHHIWVGDSSLKSRFPRLFRLCSNPGGSIQSMGKWVQGAWVWEVGWRRELLEREYNQVQIFFSIINNISLVAGAEDVWKWNTTNNGVYSTKSAYNILSQSSANLSAPIGDDIAAEIWKALAPMKARVTGWRILKRKMATCENLARRNIVINGEEAKCVACKNCQETSQHFFFTCGESMKIWENIIKWIGVLLVLGQNAKDHFLLFTNLGKEVDRSFLTGIW